MIMLIIGLAFFFIVHSLKLLAPGWREGFIVSFGENTWKAIYSLLSILALVLIVYGFGESRANPVFIWNPPVWTRHIAALLVLVAFILLAAGNIPGNRIKQKIGHPMYAGVKIWAFAHLLANGRLGDIILFGAFMIWAIIGFSRSRKADRLSGHTYPPGTLNRTLLTIVAGLALWLAFAFYLHSYLIGVAPF